MARLALGTAQLGLDYGIAGGRRIPPGEARAILDRAAGDGIELLDTAPAYGAAEELLGELATGRFRIVTKTAGANAEAVRTGLRASLARLRVPRVDALLVHDRRALLGPAGDAIWAELRTAVDAGLAGAAGVSVYHPDEARTLLGRYDLDLVQLPLNVFDQRALSTGLLELLAERGVAVHARSVFLQGLLLLGPGGVPAALARAAAPLAAFRARAARLGRTPLEAALGFVRDLPGVDTVVCGVDGLRQYGELWSAWRSPPVPASELRDLAQDDTALLDPSAWGARA